MTVDQAISASKGQMKRCSAVCDRQRTPNETALLYAPYQSGNFAFTAFAFFNNQTKKLAFISMEMDDGSRGFELIGSLRVKYGEPSAETHSAVGSITVWRTAADQIDVVRIGTGDQNAFTLGYRPRVTDSNKGL